MKLRNGFVSNSSSSSFVVLLPEDFIETLNFDEITDGDDDFPLDDFKALLDKLIKEDGIWSEEIYDFDKDDYEFEDILNNLLEPYVIATIDTSSDAGQIVVADSKKIKKILDE